MDIRSMLIGAGLVLVLVLAYAVYWHLSMRDFIRYIDNAVKEEED